MNLVSPPARKTSAERDNLKDALRIMLSSDMAPSQKDFLALGDKGFSRFWSDIPSIHADCELTAYRDRQWSKQIQPNDVRDLAQLAIAVPYCDAVVSEKFWKRAVTETGLGQKYRTEVFCDLVELLPYLESERKPKW